MVHPNVSFRLSTVREMYLVPANEVLESPTRVPASPGMYLVFLENGYQLLMAGDYWRFARRLPLEHERQLHIYTGCAANMRSRVKCHLNGDSEHSGLRKTLAAMQWANQAISKTKTPSCEVTDRSSLTTWLGLNANIVFIPCDDHQAAERQFLSNRISPLNLRRSNTPKFAEQLLMMRDRHMSSGEGKGF